MARILAIKFVVTLIKDKTTKQPTGEKTTKILMTTPKGDVWATTGQWKSSGASPSLGAYTGGNVEAIYFTKGELLFDNKTVCTEDNVILKSVFVTPNPIISAHVLSIQSENKMEEASDMASLYARQRAEKQAKLDASNSTIVVPTTVDSKPETIIAE